MTQSAAAALRGLMRKLAELRRAAPQVAPPEPANALRSLVESTGQSRLIGLRDVVLGGWYRVESGEVYEGFAITPEDVVLDVGCGTGTTSQFCARQGAHVIFADIDADCVEATAKLLAGSPARALTPLVSDADPLLLADGTASKIISLEVLEHVDDPQRFLRELSRVGRAGARYLLAVPDPVQESLQRQLAPAAFFEKTRPDMRQIRGLSSGHLRTIGREEFEHLVTGAGLVVERHGYSSFYWALWFAFFWTSGVDFSAPDHPLLDSWAQTWRHLLDAEDGPRVKQVLDGFMPKSQVILARKP